MRLGGGELHWRASWTGYRYISTCSGMQAISKGRRSVFNILILFAEGPPCNSSQCPWRSPVATCCSTWPLCSFREGKAATPPARGPGWASLYRGTSWRTWFQPLPPEIGWRHIRRSHSAGSASCSACPGPVRKKARDRFFRQGSKRSGKKRSTFSAKTLKV